MADDTESSGWQLTESDPGVFTELLSTLRVPLIVDDLYSLDPVSLASLQPLHALIFLFKYTAAPDPSRPSPPPAGTPEPDFPGFFAHQVVNNACATLAVLNALGNIHPLPTTHSSPDSSPSDLQNLLTFTAPLDPTSRGYALTSADWLRAAHNALSPPLALSLDPQHDQQEQSEAYHFVVYIPLGGAVWELDGLREFAVSHGGYDERGEGWLARAREVIEARIATYPAGALEFSLLALRDDPLPALHGRLAEIQATGAGGIEDTEVADRIANENAKRERWAFENALRRHNHLGLVHALTLALAKAGQLEGAVRSAFGRAEGRREREGSGGKGSQF